MLGEIERARQLYEEALRLLPADFDSEDFNRRRGIHALEARYGRLSEAVRNKDFEACQPVRTADFSVIDENGRRQPAEAMAQRARAMLERIQPPIESSFTMPA